MAAIFRGMGTHAHRNFSREIVIVNLSKTNLVCKNAVRVSCECFSGVRYFNSAMTLLLSILQLTRRKNILVKNKITVFS